MADYSCEYYIHFLSEHIDRRTYLIDHTPPIVPRNSQTPAANQTQSRGGEDPTRHSYSQSMILSKPVEFGRANSSRIEGWIEDAMRVEERGRREELLGRNEKTMERHEDMVIIHDKNLLPGVSERYIRTVKGGLTYNLLLRLSFKYCNSLISLSVLQ